MVGTQGKQQIEPGERVAGSQTSTSVTSQSEPPAFPFTHTPANCAAECPLHSLHRSTQVLHCIPTNTRPSMPHCPDPPARTCVSREARTAAHMRESWEAKGTSSSGSVRWRTASITCKKQLFKQRLSRNEATSFVLL